MCTAPTLRRVQEVASGGRGCSRARKADAFARRLIKAVWAPVGPSGPAGSSRHFAASPPRKRSWRETGLIVFHNVDVALSRLHAPCDFSLGMDHLCSSAHACHRPTRFFRPAVFRI